MSHKLLTKEYLQLCRNQTEKTSIKLYFTWKTIFAIYLFSVQTNKLLGNARHCCWCSFALQIKIQSLCAIIYYGFRLFLPDLWTFFQLYSQVKRYLGFATIFTNFRFRTYDMKLIWEKSFHNHYWLSSIGYYCLSNRLQ